MPGKSFKNIIKSESEFHFLIQPGKIYNCFLLKLFPDVDWDIYNVQIYYTFIDSFGLNKLQMYQYLFSNVELE